MNMTNDTPTPEERADKILDARGAQDHQPQRRLLKNAIAAEIRAAVEAERKRLLESYPEGGHTVLDVLWLDEWLRKANPVDLHLLYGRLSWRVHETCRGGCEYHGAERCDEMATVVRSAKDARIAELESKVAELEAALDDAGVLRGEDAQRFLAETFRPLTLEEREEREKRNEEARRIFQRHKLRD